MLKLARIFQSGMTLQRCKPIKIWGSTDRPQRVCVKLNGESVVYELAIDGEFTIVIPPQKAMEDAVLEICGEDTVTLTNVDIGEIWIAGGQSNMEFLLRYDAEGKEQIASANDPHFRFYDVGEYSFPEEEAQGYKDNTSWDKWLTFCPKHAEYFSAVGAYFAKELRKALNVPVAIIGCNWGGTTAATWMAESYLEEDADLRTYLDEYEQATKNLDMEEYIRKSNQMLEYLAKPATDRIMRRAMEGNMMFWEYVRAIPFLIKASSNPFPMGPWNQNAPGCLYRNMMPHVAGFSCRGVIWYQGEQDEQKAHMYDKLFSAMIRCWRDTWQDELPFLFVQLAPFGTWMGGNGNNYPVLRQRQEIVSKTIHGAYMASIMDVGMEKDIHPKEKRPVGERLAMLARGKVYGEEVLCEAPEFVGAEVLPGKLRLRFANAGAGMEIRGKKLNAIKMAVDGVRVRKSKVSVKGDTLTIWAEQFKQKAKVQVAFAWTAYCEVNLYSSAGLAAKPFKWESV